MNQNIEMNLGNGNGNGNQARKNAAIQSFRNKMEQIPESVDVMNAMILDWVNNVGVEDLNELRYEDIRDLVESMYQDLNRNAPGFSDDDYKQIYNAFSVFVREFHGEGPAQNGGKRRKHRKSYKSKNTRRGKKSRRVKKTRKHN
jgi:hypothetical protein